MSVYVKRGGNGGKRPGAGGKRGAVYAPTRDKIAAREALRRLIDRHMERMCHAQVENACGIQHFFLRAEDGTFTRVTDPEEITRALNGPVTGYRIFTKDPHTPAFTALLDRALDRPAEQSQDINLHIDGDQDLLAKVATARAKLREKP